MPSTGIKRGEDKKKCPLAKDFSVISIEVLLPPSDLEANSSKPWQVL